MKTTKNLSLIKRLGIGATMVGAAVLGGCATPEEWAAYQQHMAEFNAQNQGGVQSYGPVEREESPFRVCNRYESNKSMHFSAVKGEKETFFPGEDITVVLFSPYEGTARVRIKSFDTGIESYSIPADVTFGKTAWWSYHARDLQEKLGGKSFEISWEHNGQIMKAKTILISE